MELEIRVQANSAKRYQVNGAEAIVCSEPMRRIMQMVERVARSNASVLISGETGCGKEFIAQTLHQLSLRCSKPWIDLNCAAIPEHLVESELFGYEKGAFSGADTLKQGLFELASGGTLFLDEIGELEPKVQVKLLRVLDGVPYYRLGGNKKVSVDVRVIAATNRELGTAVNSGRFRRDLYHRLSQVQLHVPPLRERPDDVQALANYFLQQHCPGARFSSAAMAWMQNYRWPGNVRELRNMVIHVSMVADGKEIKPIDLPHEITGGNMLSVDTIVMPDMKSSLGSRTEISDLGELERQTILRTLKGTGGHQGIAAEQLGISRRTLGRKLKQYNVGTERRGNGLGVLDPEQQHYFRASIEVPVTITNARGDTLEACSVNLSSGGMCVGNVDKTFLCTGTLEIRFEMPFTKTLIKAKAQVAWADAEKKTGLKFIEIPSDVQIALNRWLLEKQHEEGWIVAV